LVHELFLRRYRRLYGRKFMSSFVKSVSWWPGQWAQQTFDIAEAELEPPADRLHREPKSALTAQLLRAGTDTSPMVVFGVIMPSVDA